MRRRGRVIRRQSRCRWENACRYAEKAVGERGAGLGGILKDGRVLRVLRGQHVGLVRERRVVYLVGCVMQSTDVCSVDEVGASDKT